MQLAAPKYNSNAALKLRFMSHGTLEAKDLEKSRKFYEEFLGLEVIRTSPISMMIRLGGFNTYAVVQNPRKSDEMPFLNHNGLDVSSREEVDRSYQVCMEQKEKWGLTKVTKPADQHGTYCFYFVDMDGNYWEILANPEGGYSWMFNKGGDLKAWGAGKDDGSNPNEFKGRGKSQQAAE